MAEHGDPADRQVTDASSGEHALPPREHKQTDDELTALGSDDRTETTVLKRFSPGHSALAVGLATVAALGGTAGWLGYQTYEIRQAQAQRNELVAAARQGALNLTTIDYTTVDTDVNRILDCLTGTFRDDFQRRSQPFVEVVKKVQSKSTGTVTAAGLQSENGDHGEVLVALAVKMSTAGAPEQNPRLWRMLIDVQKVGGVTKVSEVRFIP